MTTPLDVARAYLARGWRSVPVPYRTKTPVLPEWQNLRLGLNDLPNHFNGEPANISVLLGEPSGGLVDIDLDEPEALALADLILPATACVFGRASAPRSHREYTCAIETEKFIDSDGAMLVEIRSTGVTVFPGSTHPSGEAVEFTEDGLPARVEPAALRQAVAQLAGAATLARHWPASGGRHEAALAAAGFLLRARVPDERVVAIVSGAARVAGDPEWRDRTRAALDTVAALHAGEPVTGGPRLTEVLAGDGAKVVAQLRKWLGAEASDETWPAPEPVPDEAPPVPAFDAARLLPAPILPWISDIAERSQAPIEYVAIGALTSMAGVVGRQLAIRPKRHDDWTVVPNLWGLGIGRAGIMKSPAMGETQRPLQRLTSKAREAHQIAMRDYEFQLEEAQARKDVAKATLRAALKDGAPTDEIKRAFEAPLPEPPSERRYVVNDATVEKLGEILNDNPNGVLIFRDELAGFLRTMDREGHENDRAFYCEAWNGQGEYTYDRIGRGTVHIEAACVSILGGIQPGPLHAYMREIFGDGRSDDGLIQRFQLMVFPDVSSEWQNVDRWPNTAAKARAFEIFQRLADLDPTQLKAAQDESGLPFLRFTPEAQDVFDAWRAALEHRLRAETDEHPAVLSHLAKFRSLMPSLALLLHLVECVDRGAGGAVSGEVTRRAVAWCTCLEAHARRVYHSVTNGPAVALVALSKKIKAGKLSSPFRARAILRNGWAGLTDANDVFAALEVLCELHWLRRVEIGAGVRGGRPTVEYQVNPVVLAVSSVSAPRNIVRNPVPHARHVDEKGSSSSSSEILRPIYTRARTDKTDVTTEAEWLE
jgi:putative DNA primase/helicase